MFLKMIDMAISGYEQAGAADDVARLAFFRKVWGVQDQITQNSSASDYQMPSPQALQAWNQAGESVLSHKPIAIEGEALAEACQKIAACLVEQNVMSDAVKAALEQTEWASLVERADVSVAGKNPVAFLDAVASCALEECTEEGAGALAMVVSLALRALLEKPAAQIYQAILDASADIPRPVTCPVCGTPATLGRVGLTRSKNGRAKELWCSQCGTAWEFERVRCGRCGTQNQNFIHYFSLEGDDTHRIQNCDECGSYLRTVYQEDALTVFSPEVEDVVMAKLDEIAYEMALKQQAE